MSPTTLKAIRQMATEILACSDAMPGTDKATDCARLAARQPELFRNNPAWLSDLRRFHAEVVSHV